GGAADVQRVRPDRVDGVRDDERAAVGSGGSTDRETGLEYRDVRAERLPGRGAAGGFGGVVSGGSGSGTRVSASARVDRAAVRGVSVPFRGADVPDRGPRAPA